MHDHDPLADWMTGPDDRIDMDSWKGESSMGGLIGLSGQPFKGMENSLLRLSRLRGAKEGNLQGQDALGKKAQGQDVLGQKAQGQDVLGQKAQGQDVPGKKVQGQDMPGQKVQGQDALGQKVPGQKVNGEMSETEGNARTDRFQWSGNRGLPEDMLSGNLMGSSGKTLDESAVKAGVIQVSTQSSFQVSKQYGKMASARSTAQVQQVMGDIQQSIIRLKTAAVYGDDEQRVKAARAVRSLQKLLGRGGRKLRRLNREKLKQCAQKKAQKQREERKSRRLKLELKRMRSAGKGSDYTLVQEGMADEAYIRGYRRYRMARDAYGQPVPGTGNMTAPVLPGGMGNGTDSGVGSGVAAESGGEIIQGEVVVSSDSSL